MQLMFIYRFIVNWRSTAIHQMLGVMYFGVGSGKRPECGSAGRRPWPAQYAAAFAGRWRRNLGVQVSQVCRDSLPGQHDSYVHSPATEAVAAAAQEWRRRTGQLCSKFRKKYGI